MPIDLFESTISCEWISIYYWFKIDLVWSFIISHQIVYRSFYSLHWVCCRLYGPKCSKPARSRSIKLPVIHCFINMTYSSNELNFQLFNSWTVHNLRIFHEIGDHTELFIFLIWSSKLQNYHLVLSKIPSILPPKTTKISSKYKEWMIIL